MIVGVDKEKNVAEPKNAVNQRKKKRCKNCKRRESKKAAQKRRKTRKNRRKTRKKKAEVLFLKNKLMIEGMSGLTIRRLDNLDTSFPVIMRARSNIKSGMDPVKAHRKAFNNSHLKVKDLKALPKYLEWKKTSSTPLVEKNK